MANFIKLKAQRACNVPNSDEGFNDNIQSEICINTDHIVFVKQLGNGCLIYTDSPICTENAAYSPEGYEWKPQSVASKITVETPYEDVIKMLK